jgi:hypothetical protein
VLLLVIWLVTVCTLGTGVVELAEEWFVELDQVVHVELVAGVAIGPVVRKQGKELVVPEWQVVG